MDSARGIREWNYSARVFLLTSLLRALELLQGISRKNSVVLTLADGSLRGLTQGDLHQQIMPYSLHELHPMFVWWHTLAHRLINGMAIDSGYSSASIRERVFVDIDDQSGSATGGVLLYTAQPGGDGTLGGLIALVPQFERVLGAALRNLDACSNDPLGGEETFGLGKYNGAACYSCALISETSCEHRNMNLDRKLLLGTL